MTQPSRPSQQEIEDIRNAPKQEKAYNAASSVAPNPAPPASAPKKMAKGGSASSRADGIAQRGKTRGTMVMCGGGMARK
jgi:hypothetical protein